MTLAELFVSVIEFKFKIKTRYNVFFVLVSNQFSYARPFAFALCLVLLDEFQSENSITGEFKHGVGNECV